VPDPALSGDASSIEFPADALQKAVKGEKRVWLEAIRDYIAHELEANQCKSCKASKLRTGDQSSLILRLQTVLEEIESLPKSEEVNRLAVVRRIGSSGRTASESVSSADPSGQRWTGSRRAGGGRRTGS
jgi:hypothetical protein